MPFYNQKEMVAEMLDSILANDYFDWELLAIDDGSTPETVDYLKHYEKDNRIQFIRRNCSPKGAQTCRNLGIRLARGEYVVFFDSDDYVAPYCLKNRVEQLNNHPDLDFMVFPSGTYNDGVLKINDTHDLYGYHIYKDDLAAFLERTLPFVVWNNIYRLDSLRRNQLTWDTHLLSLQDSDFNIQALLYGLKYDYASTLPDYGYRTAINSASISKKIASEEHRQSHLYFINKQYEKIQETYQNTYNDALYLGVLYLYSKIQSEGTEIIFSRSLANIVCQYDCWHGFLLRVKIKMSILLGKIITPKMARQLPMPFFLIRKRFMERVVIPHRIIKVIKEN